MKKYLATTLAAFVLMAAAGTANATGRSVVGCGNYPVVASTGECGYPDDTYMPHNSVNYIYVDLYAPGIGNTYSAAACLENGHYGGTDVVCGTYTQQTVYSAGWIDLSVNPGEWQYSGRGFGSGWYAFIQFNGYNAQINGATYWE